MELPLSVTRRLGKLLPRSDPSYRGRFEVRGRPRVLVAGVYVGNKKNTIEHLVTTYGRSQHVDVEQRWFRMMSGPLASSKVDRVTTLTCESYVPKWMALSELVGPKPWKDFDYVLFSDDDIWIGDGFLDRLIGYQQSFDFALAQPARTWRSFTDWKIVRRRLGVKARETNFVETGPIVSMDGRFLQRVMPFSNESPMGWGYDLVWPIVARQNGLHIGIIDAVPACHSLRSRGELYRFQDEIGRMANYLATREHIHNFEVLNVYR